MSITEAKAAAERIVADQAAFAKHGYPLVQFDKDAESVARALLALTSGTNEEGAPEGERERVDLAQRIRTAQIRAGELRLCGDMEQLLIADAILAAGYRRAP